MLLCLTLKTEEERSYFNSPGATGFDGEVQKVIRRRELVGRLPYQADVRNANDNAISHFAAAA